MPRDPRFDDIDKNPAESLADRDQHRQRMIFGEISIVVTTDAPAPKDQSINTDSGLYPAVKTFLNGLTASGAPLEDYRGTWGTENSDLFQELVRTPAEANPGVFLGRNDGTGTAILFYRLGLNNDSMAGTNAAHEDPIRKLATMINTTVVRNPDNAPKQPWHLKAATPNWLTTAAQNDDSGSPASPPKAEPDPGKGTKWSFSFVDTSVTSPPPTQTDLQGYVDTARANTVRSNVVVAILDTCPTGCLRDVANNYPDNQLMNEVAGVMPSGAITLGVNTAPNPASSFTHVRQVVPSWQTYLTAYLALPTGTISQSFRDACYAMPSHGLFSAGIIKDIVPNAEIHLIGLLDDVGMSSLDMVASVFVDLPNLVAGTGKHLIVNCSWTTSTLAADIEADPLYDAVLGEIIHWLASQNILVIAAVGNDGQGSAHPPRCPARLDINKGFTNVLSVAALDVLGQNPAWYTNNGSAIGVATLGGDAFPVKSSVHTKNGKLELEPEPDPVNPGKTIGWDSVKGIFLEQYLTVTGEENTSGWVSWAGTSFATPIISAIAAVQWASRSTLVTPSDVILAIMGLAQTPVGGLDVRAIYARQDPQP